MPAVSTLIGEGINVNITLIFSLEQYEAVAQAYLRGIARLPDPRAVTSVASFFVSRVDTKVDQALDRLSQGPGIEEDGCDVPEQDPWLREVRHVAHQVVQRCQHGEPRMTVNGMRLVFDNE